VKIQVLCIVTPNKDVVGYQRFRVPRCLHLYHFTLKMVAGWWWWWWCKITTRRQPTRPRLVNLWIPMNIFWSSN